MIEEEVLHTIVVGTATVTTTTTKLVPRTTMDTQIVGGTNKAAMIAQHLEGLRRRYNTIHYFDSIRFHKSWRQRFCAVVKINNKSNHKTPDNDNGNSNNNNARHRRT